MILLLAASIAKYIAKRLGNSANSKRNDVIMNYLCPNKADYDFNNITGMKNYVNDYVRYYAHKKYGITAVAYDDKVDVWDYSWDIPQEYIPNTDYYMEHNKYGLLILGAIIYEVPEKYKGQADRFHVVKDKNEAVESIIEGQCTAVDMMISEGKAQGHDDVQHCTFTLCWKNIGDGNYEVYMLWGINKTFYSNEEFMEYCQVSDKVLKEEWSIVDEWINEYGYY